MKRLEAALALLPKESVLADIGCDHGLLSKAALDTGKAVKVYACDISAPSLEKARAALEGYNAVCIVSDGLKNVPNDFTAVAVCGMGAKTMLDILEGYDGDATLVLQPQTRASDVRRMMSERGYRIDAEITVCERKRYYSVMRFIKGEWRPTPLQIEFGLNAENGSDPVLIEKCKRLTEKYSRYPKSERTDRLLKAAETVIKNRE